MKNTISIKSVAVVLLLVTLLSVMPLNSFAQSSIENGASYLINFKNTSMGVNVQFAPKSGIGKICLDSTNNKEITKYGYSHIIQNIQLGILHLNTDPMPH